MRSRFVVFTALFLLLLVVGVSACGDSDDKGGQEVELAPESALPDFVSGASSQVKEAYRFAIANPDVLSQFPCFCACGAVGHMSNLDCYVKEFRPDGSIVFDNHAFG
ncbi:MAG: hypothetical protein GY832_13240 [Chloroflexi bacterium]|nr:hypothetical protein [Chloroflexota bacterium]